MKIRLKFTKGDEIKYIGHLDVMRLFQRALKRANLPIAYSKGFNPHQLMGFANPLSLGMTSTAEYGDFEFSCDVSPEHVKESLNAVLPDGIKVLKAVVLKDNASNCMASVFAAEYQIILDESVSPEMLEKYIPLFIAQNEIVAIKKTKHNVKETDIKEYIFDIKNISDSTAKIYMLLASGSIKSIKAELVLSALYKFMGVEFDRYKIRYNRGELFRKEADSIVPLCEGDVVF